jgi:hypothetical protein
MGIMVAIGVAIGAGMAAVTGQSWWLALGISIGAVLGVALNSRTTGPKN